MAADVANEDALVPMPGSPGQEHAASGWQEYSDCDGSEGLTAPAPAARRGRPTGTFGTGEARAALRRRFHAGAHRDRAAAARTAQAATRALALPPAFPWPWLCATAGALGNWLVPACTRPRGGGHGRASWLQSCCGCTESTRGSPIVLAQAIRARRACWRSAARVCLATGLLWGHWCITAHGCCGHRCSTGFWQSFSRGNLLAWGSSSCTSGMKRHVR